MNLIGDRETAPQNYNPELDFANVEGQQLVVETQDYLQEQVSTPDEKELVKQVEDYLHHIEVIDPEVVDEPLTGSTPAEKQLSTEVEDWLKKPEMTSQQVNQMMVNAQDQARREQATRQQAADQARINQMIAAGHPFRRARGPVASATDQQPPQAA